MSTAVKISFLIIAYVSLVNLVSGKANPSQVVSYLDKYGYLTPLDPINGKLRTSEELQQAVKMFQRMGGIPETGKLDDPELLALIEKPRCGVPDFGPADNAKRKRRHTLQGSYWKKKDLTYKILNYSPDLTPEQIETTIRDAFNEWAKVTALTFTKVTGNTKADINIKFVKGDHGDGYPFDGPGGTLAHAFYPQDNSQEIYGIDAHFDDSEAFVPISHLTLEIGILSINTGGPSSGKTSTPAPNPATATPHQKTEAPSVPDKCSSSMDAFILSEDGYTYAFKKDYFWPIGEDFGAWTNALKIRDYWPLLEENIDAGFLRRSDNVTFIFKGDKVWMFKNRSPLKDKALSITNPELNLPSELANMDAALQWARNGKVYFFKGNQYWRYDTVRKSVDIRYPKYIADGWRGVVPDNIDAAVQWKNHKSYFFKGLNYNAIDDYSVTVPRVEPPYPRKIGKYWMACSDKGQYVGGKISPVENSSVIGFIPNLLILISSLLLTTMF
ncbi:hypothetical protein QZH41_011746 [Actinostola sp. cb2023]|nr:hypothetical protein QZH41_011746 [Actinostola sp. cb2023]